MEISSNSRTPAGRTGLCRTLAGAGAAGILLAFVPGVACAQDPVTSEIERRTRAAENAQQLVAQGDEASAAGDAAEAVKQYRAALDLLPASAAGFRDLRDAVVARYTSVALTRAKEFAARGEYDQARALLNDLLSPAVAPGHKPAAVMLSEIDNPDHHNPAMTPAHADIIQKVSRLLRIAQGLMDRGSFEEAEGAYNQVLAVDPANVAARRGLEEAGRQVSNYLRAARDQTRSKMLGNVDRLWETQVETGRETVSAAGPEDDGFRQTATTGKLRLITIPDISFSGAQLVDILPELARQSIDFDTTEPDPSRRGVNVILDSGEKSPGDFPPVSLTLRQVRFDQLLDAVCQLSGTIWRFDGSTVVVSPLGSTSRISTRKFRVPPGFLSTAGSGGLDAEALFDTSAGTGGADGTAAPPSSNLVIRRMDAQEFFERSGIPFPEGTSANYIAGSNTLIVRNTEDNLNLIEEFVLSLGNEQEREVLVEVRLLKTDEKTLHELGFDHTLGQFNVGSTGLFAGGGTYGNAVAPDVDLATPRSFIVPGTGQPIGQFPVTAGLRGAFELNGRPTIDGLLAAGGAGSGGGGASGPSPGFASIAGAFTDPQFMTILRGVNQKKNIELGSTQSIVLKSGQRGSAASIRSIPFPTEFDPPQIPQNITSSQTILVDQAGNVIVLNDPQAPGFPVTPTTPQNFEVKDTGSALEVEASVSPDGSTVDLNLSVSFREFDGFINYGTPITDPATGVVLTENRIIQPVVSNTSETVNVTLYDGAHMAIGGLLDGKWETIEDKVPILGSLPFVGRLFKSEVRQVSRRAIVYLVTVKVIDPAGVGRQEEVAAREAAASPGLPP